MPPIPTIEPHAYHLIKHVTEPEAHEHAASGGNEKQELVLLTADE